jgi:hypothetical protein
VSNKSVINVTHMSLAKKQRIRSEIFSNKDSIIVPSEISVKDMIKSRNTDVKEIAKIVSTCDTLNKFSSFSPRKLKRKIIRAQEKVTAPKPFSMISIFDH